MSRGRLLIVVGGLVSLCASAGLLLFGPSVVRVLDVLTWRLGEPEGEALGGLLAAAICALLFAVGVGLACGGQVVASRTQAATITGRLLLALVGAGGVCAALAIIGGVLGAQRALYTVANTAAAQSPEVIHEAVSQTVLLPTIGFTVLLLAQALLVAAGLLGFKGDPRPSRSSIGVAGLGVAAVVFGLLFALLFVANWWLHARSLEALTVAADQMARPAQLAGHLSAIMRNAQLAAVCLAIGGLLQVTLALLLPGKARS